MRRQTRQPDQWIIASGGHEPPICSLGQTVVHQPMLAGPRNFATNLLSALALAEGDVIVVIEDDDWYGAKHIESMVAALDPRHALISGRHETPYYHVSRCWRMMSHSGHSSLCQTAFKRGAITAFESVVRGCLESGSFYIDIEFWRRIARAQWAVAEGRSVVGIKGMYPGLGIGHRPAGLQWKSDPDLVQLRAWIGDDADAYEAFAT